MCDYGWFAMRFGWDPQRVDALPAWYEARLPAYTEVWDQVMAERRQG